MNLSQKLLLPAIFGVALTVATPTVQANFGDHSGATNPADIVSVDEDAMQEVLVEVIVGDAIGLDCEDTVSLGEILGFGDNQQDIACSVFTNSPAGYQVTIDELQVIAWDQTVEGGNIVGQPAETNEQFLPGNTADMTDAAKAAWALSMDSGTTWVSDAGEVLLDDVVPTAATGNDFDITVGAHIGSNVTLQTGTYKGSFTLTASAL